MQAKTGDWLLIKTHTEDQHSRGGVITEVGDDGNPPYTVHWLDTGRESVVFPGPDALVRTPEEQDAHDKTETERAYRAQQLIAAQHAAD